MTPKTYLVKTDLLIELPSDATGDAIEGRIRSILCNSLVENRDKFGLLRGYSINSISDMDIYHD